MTIHRLGIILNGVTGRMGTHQHLYRSLAAIIKQGGVPLDNGDAILPDPLLVGRNLEKLQQVAAGADLPEGALKLSTNLASALADKNYPVYFDSQTTDRRAPAVTAAIAAGKHIYCEKPTALTTAEALHLHNIAENAGVKHGVVQDKLWLPGIVKLKRLIDSGFFGTILSVRGEFGYWVFTGQDPAKPAQRPSWNYRQQDGGGVILDMLCHWRYLVDNTFGNITSLSCLGVTHIPTRWDESRQPYPATADDAAYATFQVDNPTGGNIICHFNSSWCTRVRRDDLLTLHVDGTHGSAVAGLRNCLTQSLANTPRPIWNPDVAQPLNFYDNWTPAPTPPSAPAETFDNAFKIQWELFLKHIVTHSPFRWSLLEAAKGVQLAELAQQSSTERRWLDVPALV